MSAAHSGAKPHYYVPQPSHWPITGSLALLLMASGAALCACLVAGLGAAPLDSSGWSVGIDDRLQTRLEALTRDAPGQVGVALWAEWQPLHRMGGVVGPQTARPMGSVYKFPIALAVLIAAARGGSEQAARAMEILDDPEREFAASPFLRLEVLPQAVFNKREAEVAFYEAFFW